jgi:hypothetical protein
MGGPWNKDFDELVVIALIDSGGRRIPGARHGDYCEAVRRLVERHRMSDGQVAWTLARPRRSVMRTRIALGIAPVFPRGTGNAGNGRDLWSTAPSRPRALR